MPSWARGSTARTVLLAGLGIVLAASFGTGLLYFMLGPASHDEALDARGKVVLAKPISYRLASTSQGGAVKRYNVRLAFTDADGNPQTTTIETNHQSQREAAEAKTPLEIEYDPQDPSRARWPGTKLNPLGNSLYWLGAGVAAMGLAFAVLGWFLGMADRRLYRTGAARLGRIDRVEPIVENNRTIYRIDYSYDAEGGRVQSTWVARKTGQPEVGPIWVIVRDSDPYKSIPVLESV